MAISSLQITKISLSAKRSALNFAVFLVIAVGITIFILKQSNAALEEIEKLEETLIYGTVELK